MNEKFMGTGAFLQLFADEPEQESINLDANPDGEKTGDKKDEPAPKYTDEDVNNLIEKKFAELRLSEAERAMKVKELERAFEEYQQYVDEGGNLGFAAWFWANVKAGGSWSDLVKEAISTFTQGPDSPTDPTKKQKKGKDVSYNFNTAGNTERLAQNILGNVKKEVEKGQQTKKLRDVQNTVNNAVASRMVGQGAAPQGVGNAAPINTSWGRA